MPPLMTNLEYRLRLHDAALSLWPDPEQARAHWLSAYNLWLAQVRAGKTPEQAYELVVLGMAQLETAERIS